MARQRRCMRDRRARRVPRGDSAPLQEAELERVEDGIPPVRSALGFCRSCEVWRPLRSKHCSSGAAAPCACACVRARVFVRVRARVRVYASVFLHACACVRERAVVRVCLAAMTRGDEFWASGATLS